MLEQLAYVSTSTTRMDSLTNIAELLATSQRNNWRDRITGSLVYSDGRFFQVVEGEPTAIDRLMRRVATDTRHKDIRIVLRKPLEARVFPDWSMAIPRVSPEMAPMMREAVEDCVAQPEHAIDTLHRLTTIDAIHT